MKPILNTRGAAEEEELLPELDELPLEAEDELAELVDEVLLELSLLLDVELDELEEELLLEDDELDDDEEELEVHSNPQSARTQPSMAHALCG